MEKAPDMIRAWLDQEGRKVSWLARECCVDRATASQWLNSRRVPHPIHRQRLAELTGLPVDAAALWPGRVAA